MGVYTIAVNHDLREVVDPGEVGESLKAHQWAWLGDAVLGMLRSGKRWAGHRVELVDDVGDAYYRLLDEYRHLDRGTVAFDGLNLTDGELETYVLRKLVE